MPIVEGFRLFKPTLASFLVILTLSLGLVLLQAVDSSGSGVKVGVYYYSWYPSHWNGSDDWIAVDKPLLGLYDSADENVIRQHMDWFKEIGIDFVVISWWGTHNADVLKIDNAVKTLFSVAEDYAPWINVAIMVEAFNEALGPDAYNFTEIFNYIYETYVAKYSSIWMRLDGKPLLCWYNGYNMTGGLNEFGYMDGGYYNIAKIRDDSRFESRIVGHNSYVDWWFAIPSSVNNSTVPPLSPKDGMICVEPRYDDQFLRRDKNSTFDSNLVEGLYEQQWNEVIGLAREGKIELVTIYSWNEYHERSQIEPHKNIDGKHVLSLYYQTKYYVGHIEGTNDDSILTALTYIALGILIGAVPAWTYFILKRRKHQRNISTNSGLHR